MRCTIILCLFAMLFATNVWAMYGVGLLPRATLSVACENCEATSIRVEAVTTTAFETPVSASLPSGTALNPHASTVVSPIAAPPANINDYPSTPLHELSTGAKIGIGIGVALFLLLIALLIIGVPYLRHRRCTRALQRAVEEVERGTEMQKANGSRSDGFGASKDNMVLESRVEIVVDDDESARDMVASWDGWNATWDEEDEFDRGRKGMSLPRRIY